MKVQVAAVLWIVVLAILVAAVLTDAPGIGLWGGGPMR